MAKVVLFGLQETAELAHYYLKVDSEHEVVAFSVHQAYMPKDPTFLSLPIIAFEEVETVFPPEDYVFFAPMSPLKMNTLRASIYDQIKGKGYDCINYISSKATVFNTIFGQNCFVQEGCTLQPYSELGNNVMIWSDSTVGHHTRIKDHVTLAAQVMVNGHCEIGENTLFSINSCVAYGIKVAKGTFVEMGAAIANHTQSWSSYAGVPAAKYDTLSGYQ